MSRLAATKSLVRSLVTSEPAPPDPHSRDDHDDSSGGDTSPQERIKRVAVRTMDLGRSFTSRPRPPTPSMPSHPESKRTPSLKRKDRGKEAQGSQDQGQGDFSQEKCFRMSSLLNLLKAMIPLPCHRSPMDHKQLIMYLHGILLRLSRMMIHPSLRLHRQPLHPRDPCCSLSEISVQCVWHFLFTFNVCLMQYSRVADARRDSNPHSGSSGSSLGGRSR